MAAMVLVNNPGTWRAVYAPLKHADWHGLTPTDVIFPFFLFIVGVAIPLSRPTPGRVVRRMAIIGALGLSLCTPPPPGYSTPGAAGWRRPASRAPNWIPCGSSCSRSAAASSCTSTRSACGSPAAIPGSPSGPR